MSTIVLELRSVTYLLLHSSDELLVHFEALVLPLQCLKFIFSDNAVGDQVKLEFLGFALILEYDNPLGLPLLDPVHFVSLFKVNNLANHILPMVGYSHECIFHSFLEIGVLNPLAQLPASHTNLLKFLQFDFFDPLSGVSLRCNFWVQAGTSSSWVTAANAMSMPRVIVMVI